jgi:thiol-disulfide isomerase/thioredoxin
MMDVKPFWYFIAGMLILYLFALLVIPSERRRHGGRSHWRPAPQHLLGPGGTQRMLGGYEPFGTIEGFDTGSKFFMFGVDWCPHCRSAKPEFQALGTTKTIGGHPVTMQYVDPEKETEAAKGFEISGYPTFYLVHQGQKHRYQGPRTKAGFEQFLSEQLSA